MARTKHPEPKQYDAYPGELRLREDPEVPAYLELEVHGKKYKYRLIEDNEYTEKKWPPIYLDSSIIKSGRTREFYRWLAKYKQEHGGTSPGTIEMESGFGVDRTSIWKHVEVLEESGFIMKVINPSGRRPDKQILLTGEMYIPPLGVQPHNHYVIIKPGILNLGEE